MYNLMRALRMAMRYKWSLIFSFIGSLGVAIMWGANIGTVAPFIKVIFENKSLNDWVDGRIAEDLTEIQQVETQLAALQAGTLPTGLTADKVPGQIGVLQDQLAAANQSLSLTQWVQPFVRDYFPDTAFETLVVLIGIVIAGTFIRGAFLVMNMYLVARLGKRTVLDMQNQFFEQTLHLELSEIGKNGTGDLVSRIRGETGAIGMAITTLLGKTIREPLKMFACLACAAAINPRLLVFSMIVSPIAGVVMLVMARSMKRLNRRAVEESARLLNRLFQSITYIKAVKSFNMETHELRRFKAIAQDVYRKSMRISMLSSLSRLNNELLGVSIICIGILAGGYLVLGQKTEIFGIKMCDRPMSVGTMMTFFAFLVATADPLRKMGDVYSMIQGGMVAADRVFPLLDKQSAIVSPANPVGVPKAAPVIEFKDIRFSYLEGIPVLHGLNARIPAGKSVAIVGANGCGKSTLVNFLPRFFDPDSGSIELNGVDIRKFNLQELRSQVGVVTQQSMLFDDTIANNIAYGSEGATREEIINAARKAHAHEFIESNLELGYESTVGEHGGKLSGGQRQRIELARVILKNPSVLILDEATSQIDPTSESLIHQALQDFIGDRTVILITHRMTTLELADYVMVMDKGQVLDFGTHEELYQRCEAYRTMRELGMDALNSTMEDADDEDSCEGQKAA